MDIELEAIVPTSSRLLPYFWATGEEFERFERYVLSDSSVKSVTQLDRIDETELYRIEWSSHTDGLLSGLVETKAVVLEAVTINKEWIFRVRFPTHNLLGEFYNFCTEQNISVHVERVYALTDASRTGRIFDLTSEQSPLHHGIVS